MTLSSDQDKNPDGLSTTSQRMLALRKAVFIEWEKRVRASVKESTDLPLPVLVDSLPVFYDNIAQAVTADYPRTDAVEGTTLAGEHGGERARLTKFDPQALIGEYQIFRWVIFDVLHQHGVILTHPETLAINASIDAGIREAVTAFSLVHAALREQFVAALTHDLRGPLATASMAFQLILMETDPTKMKSFAAKGAENVSRMDGMIQDLLDSMASPGGQRMQLALTCFDIADVIKEVQLQAATAHAVRFQTFGASVKGWWDRGILKRVIENLVGNAVKYGDMTKPIRISFAEAFERLVLMVHNEGQPIPPEEQADVFQLFRRAQAARQGNIRGWGIGLPFVRSAAESHGGSIGIDSTPERGTTLTLDIPRDARPFQSDLTTPDHVEPSQIPQSPDSPPVQ